MHDVQRKLVALVGAATVAAGAFVAAAPAGSANPVSGAIFTTVSNGSEP